MIVEYTLISANPWPKVHNDTSLLDKTIPKRLSCVKEYILINYIYIHAPDITDITCGTLDTQILKILKHT